jgi:hypothetical protein
MPTMTKRSRRVLCLCLLIPSVAFLVYCTSPTARASIQKPTVASMPVPRKLIQLALVDLHHEETTTDDKWLTLGAICELIYTRFDFDAGVDFTARDLKKAANEVGPLGSKISQGNHTIVRSRMMELRRKYFVNDAKKNIERKPGNAAFQLARMCLNTTTRKINAACLLCATSLYC